MKTKIHTLTFLTILLCLFQTNNVLAKKTGYRESYGGDGTISEFQSIAQDVLRTIKDNQIHFNNVDLNYSVFNKTVKNLKITCKSNLILNGIPKDAINYPKRTPQELELDCDKWNKGNKNFANKLRLVNHEYLHLMFIDDSNYFYSNQLTNSYFKLQLTEKERGNYLISTAKKCDLASYNKTLKTGINIFYHDESGENVFSTAIRNNCLEIVKDLIELNYNQDTTLSAYQYLILITSFDFSTLNTLEEKHTKALEIIKLITQNNPSFVNRNLTLNALDDSLSYDKVALDFLCLDSYSIFQALDKGFIYHNLQVQNADIELNELLQKLNFKNLPYNGCGASQ
jgi:hypothetical protein